MPSGPRDRVRWPTEILTSGPENFLWRDFDLLIGCIRLKGTSTLARRNYAPAPKHLSYGEQRRLLHDSLDYGLVDSVDG